MRQHWVIFSLSLSVLVHAIGDASEITQNSTDKKLRMVEKETDCRLKHLQVNVERLKSILLTSDLGWQKNACIFRQVRGKNTCLAG